jgi:hypothetical protein
MRMFALRQVSVGHRQGETGYTHIFDVSVYDVL